MQLAYGGVCHHVHTHPGLRAIGVSHTPRLACYSCVKVNLVIIQCNDLPQHATCRLSGQIPRHITLSLYLRELNLEHNALSGPLDEALWLLPHLRLLDVSHNTLTGSLPEAVGCGNSASD